MKLIVISPETEDSREHPAVMRFFAAGLESYHLRKPEWSREQLVGWLTSLPEEFHARIVLHTHHELADDFEVGGLHFRGTDGPASSLMRSRAVHDLEILGTAVNRYDRVLFSPVFPSISKSGYQPDLRITQDELKAVLARPRRAEVIALGGVDRSQFPVCHSLGFDGVATLGVIWKSDNPVAAFDELQRALPTYAA